MLRSIDLIVRDPEVLDGEVAAIRGTGMPVSFVLAELAAGYSEHEVEDRSGLERWYGRPHPYLERPREGIRAAAAYGAALAREEDLPRPAAAGFADATGGDVPLEEAKRWASTVLDQLAAGMSRDAILGRYSPLSEELFAAAVGYGATLARHDPLAAPESETLEETFLRDLLTPRDRKLIDDLYLYRSENSPLPTPESLFSHYWKWLVEKVESGYQDDYWEYTLRLERRDMLEDVVSMVSPSSQARLHEEIRPWDRRFEAATRPSTRRIFAGPRHPWIPLRWWYYRVARRFGRAMAQLLHEHGLLDDEALRPRARRRP